MLTYTFLISYLCQGNAAIEGIFLQNPEINKKKELSPTVFKNIYRLKSLKINSYDEDTMKGIVSLPRDLQFLPDALRCLCWENYPLKSLPQNFNLQNLVELVVTNSHINDLSWHGVQVCLSLLLYSTYGLNYRIFDPNILLS